MQLFDAKAHHSAIREGAFVFSERVMKSLQHKQGEPEQLGPFTQALWFNLFAEHWSLTKKIILKNAYLGGFC